MRKSYVLLSASMVVSMLALSGCMLNPSAASPTPTVSVSPKSEADKLKQANKDTKPTLTQAGVKSIKPEPVLKAGKKLSAEEVEDLIRKLSVCRPT